MRRIRAPFVSGIGIERKLRLSRHYRGRHIVQFTRSGERNKRIEAKMTWEPNAFGCDMFYGLGSVEQESLIATFVE